MRLGTCIALELAVAVGAMGGVWFGVGHSLELAAGYMGRPAEAATRSSIAPTRLPSALLVVEPPRPPTSVFGASDEALLAPLAGEVVLVKPNRGGTSLSLRIDFASGARASFKPEQIHMQSDPRREIAAYRMDRLLGIGRVPPARPIKFTVAELLAAADPNYRTYTTTRITEEAIARGGVLRGQVSWWIPEIRDARLGGLLLDDPVAMRQWASYLQIGADIPPDLRRLVEQIAVCVVFDVVIDNADRWSGANVKVSPDQQVFYLMDNTLSFSHFKHGHEANLAPLRRMQVFPRALIARLRALELEQVEAALAMPDDPAGLGALLRPEEVRAIMARRNHVLALVDVLIAQYGEDKVLALP